MHVTFNTLILSAYVRALRNVLSADFHVTQMPSEVKLEETQPARRTEEQSNQPHCFRRGGG
jgi:hypothetical protein